MDRAMNATAWNCIEELSNGLINRKLHLTNTGQMIFDTMFFGCRKARKKIKKINSMEINSILEKDIDPYISCKY